MNNKTILIAKYIFICIIIIASLWLFSTIFNLLSSILDPNLFLGLKPLIYILVIWKAYKWSNNEFDNQFNN